MIGAAALYQDLRKVRTELTTARTRLQAAVDDPGTLRTAEGRAVTRAGIDGAVQSVATARRRTSGSPVISATRIVPGLSTQRSALLRLIDDSAVAATAGSELLGKIDALAERTQVRDGLVPFEGLRQLRADVATTGTTIGRVVRSSKGLWGPIGDARRKFDEVAASTSARLTEGAEAVDAALPFMGAGGDRRYLIAAQNNAEMRDQGMVLSYAVVSFRGGRLMIERNGSVGDLVLRQPAPTPIPPGTQEVFGSLLPTTLWQSVNAGADFALSGRAMADMYRQAAGEEVDGVIAVDVPGLAALLRAVGPVQVDGIPEPVTDVNAARILLQDLYKGLGPQSSQAPRRERLSEVTRAVIDRLTTGSRDVVGVGRELADAALGGHFRLWSAAEQEERVFERTGLGGGPGAIDPDRTFHVAVENRTATKLDYYVQPSVRAEVSVRANGDALVRTFVVVDNQAPADGEPSYALGPDQFTSRPGDYIAWVLLWGPAGSAQAGSVAESALRLSQGVMNVGPGQRLETTFETVVPGAVRDGRLMLRFVPQSRLKPVDLDVRLVEASGWRVLDAASLNGPWDRVRTVNWRLGR